MKILVTGGAGFIGSHITDAYIAAGNEVVIVDNLSTGKIENVNPKAKFYELDLCSNEALKVVEEEKPAIINHQAAQIDVRISVADPINDIKINVIGLVGLLETGRKNGLKKVIFASSGGTVYGEQDEFPASENHSTWPVSPYGLNKLACEKYLHFYKVQYGIDYVALRYGNVYGPRQNPHGEAGVVAIFVEKMLSGEQPVINGEGKRTRDYVYVDDVVSANLIALNDKASCAYNVGTSVETDVNTIFRNLKEFTNSQCSEEHGPDKPGEQSRVSISPARIERELGWRCNVPLAEGMSKTVEWFRTRNS